VTAPETRTRTTCAPWCTRADAHQVCTWQAGRTSGGFWASLALAGGWDAPRVHVAQVVPYDVPGSGCTSLSALGHPDAAALVDSAARAAAGPQVHP